MKNLGAVLLVMVLAIGLGGSVLAADAPDGKALYEAKCAMCHGKDGVAKPVAKTAPNFNDPKFQAEKSAQAIEKVITEAQGKHQALKDKFTPEQITAIAAHVKTLK